jgi:F0F1-type ATP synthase membrane subunit c/vacuolar-type H+-ATPase subunit K
VPRTRLRAIGGGADRRCGISATRLGLGRSSAAGGPRWHPDVSPGHWGYHRPKTQKASGHDRREFEMRKTLEVGGLVAAVVLMAFGIGAVYMGIDGRSTVRDSLRAEQIVGSPDMNATAIAAEAKAAGLPTGIALPTADVANKPIVTGQLARDFASYMRIHALEASGGLTYSQMSRYATADGKGTNDAAKALKGPSGTPLDNPVRSLWVTETALSTALNTSFMAEQMALFGIVVGIALLLTGLGLGILAVGGTLRNPDPALQLFGRKTSKVAGATPVPTA